MNDLDTKLAELDAQLAEQSVTTEAEELAEKQQELADKQALVKAIKDYGKVGKAIHWLKVGGRLVIVKRPKNDLWRTAKMLDSAQERNEQIAFGCRIYPTAEEFARLVDEYPMTVDNVVTLASLLAGFASESSVAK